MQPSDVSPEKIRLVEKAIGQRGHLIDFVRMAWPIVEPVTPFVEGWHVGAICEHLEAVSKGEIRKLVINVPPGSSKSLLTSVFWPCWEWINRPVTRWIVASFDASLTLRDSRRMISILRSHWFCGRWGNILGGWGGATDTPRQVAAGGFSNIHGGWRFNTSVEGKMTGRHCDIMVIDDPLKPQDVSATTLEACKRWWRETVPSRFGNQATGRRVMIMQRLHEEDLAGVALAEGGYEHLRIPMRFEPSVAYHTSRGEDPRKDEGTLMDPERFSEAVVKQLEKDMGSRVAAAQLQQRPTPQEGAVFKETWFAKRWRACPARFEKMIQSWDCTFKDTDGSDYVCGQLWGVIDAEYYLLDRIWDRMDLPTTCEAIKRWTRQYPKAITKLIEDKANGPAVVQTLKKTVMGLLEVTPEGGKISRANAVAPLCEAGNVILPDPSVAPWVDGMMHELTTFPFAAHDDQVDAMSQALTYLHGHSSSYAAAMAKAKGMGLAR